MAIAADDSRVLWYAQQIIMDEEYNALRRWMQYCASLPRAVLEALEVEELGELASADDEKVDFGIVTKKAGERDKDGKIFAHIRKSFVDRMEYGGAFDRVRAVDPDGEYLPTIERMLRDMEDVFDAMNKRVRADLERVDREIALGAQGYEGFGLDGKSLVDLFDDHQLFHTLRVLQYTQQRPGTDVVAGVHWDRAGFTYHVRDSGGGLYLKGVPYVAHPSGLVPVWIGHQAEIVFRGGLGSALLHEVRGVDVPRWAIIFFVAVMKNGEYAPHYAERRAREKAARTGG